MNLLKYIEFRNTSFEYIKDKKVINSISTKVYKDDITAIVGPNGSGKTTLGKLMIGILKPTFGKVYMFNKDIKYMTLGQVGKQVGYLFQNPEKQFFSCTVEEEIGFVLKIKGFDREYIDKKVEYLLELFQLDHLKEAFPLKLSQGEKQRLAIAAILANEPEYLILDEPTKGLDMDRKTILVDILEKLNEKGIGITLISHDYNLVNQISNRVIEIYRGEIVEDRRNKD